MDIIIILVAHKVFQKINKSLINKKIVIDIVGILLYSVLKYIKRKKIISEKLFFNLRNIYSKEIAKKRIVLSI